jgi:hypothetical protein
MDHSVNPPPAFQEGFLFVTLSAVEGQTKRLFRRNSFDATKSPFLFLITVTLKIQIFIELTFP